MNRKMKMGINMKLNANDRIFIIHIYGAEQWLWKWKNSECTCHHLDLHILCINSSLALPSDRIIYSLLSFPGVVVSFN